MRWFGNSFSSLPDWLLKQNVLGSFSGFFKSVSFGKTHLCARVTEQPLDSALQQLLSGFVCAVGMAAIHATSVLGIPSAMVFGLRHDEGA